MSDDYIFGDENLDESILMAGLDVFEAEHNLLQQPRATPAVPAPDPAPVAPRSGFRPPSEDDEYEFEDSLDFEKMSLKELDELLRVETQQPQKGTSPVAEPSNAPQLNGTFIGNPQQRTLRDLPVPPGSRQKLLSRQEKTTKRVKTWDLSPTNLAVGPPPPMKLAADLKAVKTWVYPLNMPKRDYQFNIVQKCLLENTLVALPTGLGKTFIAGAVMLNFYRWFPSGKVIFVAPSKPLVTQQVEACHRTCGIPGSDAVELTGEVPGKKRIESWKEKRVFYMTPQTLMNDLLNGACDPSRVILLVIDEAHRGKGNYAYARIIRELMHSNTHFRVLALTATPGSKPEDVQELCDAMHVSHIEIRDEHSPDLKQYVFDKGIEQHIVEMSDEILQTRTLLAGLMEPLIEKVQGGGLLPGNPDPVRLNSYRCQAEVTKRASCRSDLKRSIGILSTLARAMGYLCEESAKMCYDTLKAMGENSGAEANAQNKYRAITRGEKYKELMLGLERLDHFPPHPKMKKLKSLVLDHLWTKGATGEGGGTGEFNPNARVVVFVSYRDCVEEVADYLNLEYPIIKATRFVGQGKDKGGRKGFAQKEQLDVIKEFKAGKFNVLVSTSIGEEGLDIGEIDMIVCYDAQKTPIRMLQRIGRTGRKREGRVHVLLAQGREEANWDKAQAKYHEIQHHIISGDRLELYGDVDRLIPDDVDPVCEEQVVKVEEYVRERPKDRGSRAANPPKKAPPGKRKRNADPGVNTPGGESTVFVPVSELVENAAKRRRKDIALDDDASLEGDSDSRDLEESLSGLKRATSNAGLIPAASKAKTPRKRNETTVDGEQRKRPTNLPARNDRKTPRQGKMVSNGRVNQVPDEDDETLKGGLPAVHPPPGSPISVHSSSGSDSPSRMLKFPSPVGPPLSDNKSPFRITLSPSQPRVIPLDPVPPSPPSRARSTDPDPLLLSALQHGIKGGMYLPADGDRSSPGMADSDHDVSVAESPKMAGKRATRTKFESAMTFNSRQPVRTTIPPPPTHLRASATPEATFPVRPGFAKGPAKRKVPMIEDDVDGFCSSPPVASLPRRLRQRRTRSRSPSPKSPPRKRTKGVIQEGKKPRRDKTRMLMAPEWVTNEAVHSGGEASDGAISGAVDQSENEYDREFVNDSPSTPISPSYSQMQVYRGSLLSQDARDKGPLFARGPMRHKPFGNVDRRSPQFSSSPARDPEEGPDEYETGSFVVPDDAEISCSLSSDL